MQKLHNYFSSVYVVANVRVDAFFSSFFFFCRWPAMCIHGDKSQPERDWVLTGTTNPLTQQKVVSVFFFVVSCSA